MPKATRLTVYDAAEGAPLSALWRLGTLVDGSMSVGARNWNELYAAVDRAYAEAGEPIDLQIWAHGSFGRVYIDRVNVTTRVFIARLKGKVSSVWFRTCSTAGGWRGRLLFAELMTGLQCVLVGHCDVISAPNPLRQPKGVAYCPEDGKPPWWPIDGAGQPGCSTLAMKIPRRFFRG